MYHFYCRHKKCKHLLTIKHDRSPIWRDLTPETPDLFFTIESIIGKKIGGLVYISRELEATSLPAS